MKLKYKKVHDYGLVMIIRRKKYSWQTKKNIKIIDLQ